MSSHLTSTGITTLKIRWPRPPEILKSLGSRQHCCWDEINGFMKTAVTPEHGRWRHHCLALSYQHGKACQISEQSYDSYLYNGNHYNWKDKSATLHIKTHCGLVTTYGVRYLSQHWIRTSGNGLLPDGTKPLPEAMLTYHHTVQRHSSEGNFTINTSAINHWNYLENYLSKISFKSPRGQWVKTQVYHPQQSRTT